MCSLNRTMSLSVFPREPAASLDATVDYVKVGTPTPSRLTHCNCLDVASVFAPSLTSPSRLGGPERKSGNVYSSTVQKFGATASFLH